MTDVMLREPTDDQLLRQSHGSPHAFAQIFDRHFDAVLAYARSRVGADGGAEIASETFARAFAQRDRYREGAAGARPWLLGIATNLIGDYRRAEARHLRWLVGARAEVSVDEAAQAVDRVDAAKHLRTLAGAVASLKRVQRDVLLLHAWADLSPEQIAQVLDMPAGTVRSHLSRARAHLREATDGRGTGTALEADNG